MTGSVSGTHQGTIQPHSDGRRASFVPAGPFTPGERVTVSTSLDVRGAQDGDYGFTIRRGEYETGRSGSDRAVPRPRTGTYHTYRSDPSLKAPRLVVTRRRPGRAPGYLVLNTGWDEERPRPEGLLIADDRGRPVYFKQRTAERKIFDVAVQRYQGRPVITYWEGRFAAGWGYGDYVVLDESYREILRVEAKRRLPGRHPRHAYHAREHAARAGLQPRRARPAQRRRSAQRRGAGQRDPGDRTCHGRLLFEWHSLGMIGLRESYDRPERGESFDYFHLNSMDVGPDGDITISARNTCAVYELDRTTGVGELAAERQAQRLPARPRSTLLPPARRAG